MVKVGDEITLGAQAHDIAKVMMQAAYDAAGGGKDFRADELRLQLAALPVHVEPARQKMPPSMVDLFVWITEASLKSGMT